MTISRQKIFLMGSGAIIIGFIAFIIYPLFSGIQTESANFISQRNQLAELDKETQNLQSFQKSNQSYQDNLAKIEKLFINSSEPVDFIDFLEEEARNANLNIEILPFVPNQKDKPWPSMNFQLSLTGNFPDFLKFMERLESAPYLINILNLNITKGNKTGTDTTLLIKVYTK